MCSMSMEGTSRNVCLIVTDSENPIYQGLYGVGHRCLDYICRGRGMREGRVVMRDVLIVIFVAPEAVLNSVLRE